jgi:peptidoglycan hydrolase-like protein with peptidoglycan-binding domain
VAFWDSIKNEKNPRLLEAYLNRYPNGTFSDIARVKLQDTKIAALPPAKDVAEDKVAITDPALAREVRERLFELNFDPGPSSGPVGEAAHRAIREFQQMANLTPDGEMSQGLLRRLREAGKLKPWGAIVYARSAKKWGMAWSQESRQAAVASARASCGSEAQCPVEISFFGTECGALAHAEASWAIVARKSVDEARESALSGCGKRGRACRIVAAVCADGAERTTPQ